MKDIDPLNGASDYLSKKSVYYRKLNTMHKELNPWIKAVHALSAITLAVSAACNAQKRETPYLTAFPETPTEPAPGDLGEIIENPTVAAEHALQRITGSLENPSDFSVESVINQHPELKGRNVSAFAIKINQNRFEFATTADVDPAESWAVISEKIVIQGQQITGDQVTIQN